MNNESKWLKPISAGLGFVSLALLAYAFIVFSGLRPAMIAFEPLSPFEESFIDWIPLGLVMLFAFYLLSLFRMARHLQRTSRVTFAGMILVISGVISFLLVFSDAALLHDITKQYSFDMAQPEWSLLYPIMGFQSASVIVFTYLHLSGYWQPRTVERVARDSNIFIAVQYVGLICGLMGLALSSLGFLYRQAWSLQVHTTMSTIILLSPYALAVAYWLLIKLREEQRQWYDEKQLLDVGKSAFLTLITSAAFLTALFVVNYNSLDGVISVLWLPIYLFFAMFLFSLGTLYFSAKEA